MRLSLHTPERKVRVRVAVAFLFEFHREKLVWPDHNRGRAPVDLHCPSRQ